MRPRLVAPSLLAVLAPAAGAQSVTMEPAELHVGQTDREDVIRTGVRVRRVV